MEEWDGGGRIYLIAGLPELDSSILFLSTQYLLNNCEDNPGLLSRGYQMIFSCVMVKSWSWHPRPSCAEDKNVFFYLYSQTVYEHLEGVKGEGGIVHIKEGCPWFIDAFLSLHYWVQSPPWTATRYPPPGTPSSAHYTVQLVSCYIKTASWLSETQLVSKNINFRLLAVEIAGLCCFKWMGGVPSRIYYGHVGDGKQW